jgi:iduronate 2-sulfatase
MRTLLLTVAMLIAVPLHAADRPNVLLICVDDLKPLLGCYGDLIVKSPNIDRLAQRGLRFDRAYCNQAVCAPSRNALLTGLRPQSLGIYDLATNFRAAAPDAVTLPQHFKANGYRTESLGKIFHVGHGNHDDAASWSVPSWKANVVGYALKESRAERGLTREEARFANEADARAASLPRGAAYESADVPDNAYADGRMAREAVRRLEAAAKTPDEPFFLAVGFVKPHLPFCAPKKYWDLYDPADFNLPERPTPPDGAPPFAPTTWGELRQYKDIPEEGPLPDDLQRKLIHGYHAAVSYMDAQLGLVIDALDKNGLADNTVIVFWGDHGWHLGDHGMWCKHTNYEQATRAPLIVADGRKAARRTSDALVEFVDVYPTLAELAGLPLPEGLEGTSFAPLLADPSRAWKKAAFSQYPRGVAGTGRVMGYAMRTARHRLVAWEAKGRADYELYDLEKDPGETVNLAATPEHAELLKTLLAQLKAGWKEARP